MSITRPRTCFTDVLIAMQIATAKLIGAYCLGRPWILKSSYRWRLMCVDIRMEFLLEKKVECGEGIY